MYRILILLFFTQPVISQIATTDYVPGQIIVKFKEGKSTIQKANLRAKMNASFRIANTNRNSELWSIAENQDIPEFIKQYRNHRDIEYIGPNYYYYLNDDDYKESELCDDGFSTTQEEDLSLWQQLKRFFSESSSKRINSHLMDVTTEPDDSQYLNQWALQNWGQNGGTPNADIDAPGAWDMITDSPSVVIGVIDTGVDWTHPDLVNNIWQNLGEDADGDGRVLEWNGTSWIFDPGDVNDIDDDGNGKIDDFVGWDFSDNDNDPSDHNGHGTHVAGTIGAEGNNGIGVAGVTWNTQIAALKIFSNDRTSSSVIAEAIDYAVMMSIPLSNNSYGNSQTDSHLADALENAQNHGHLYIAASGNYNTNNDDNPYYPASYPFDNIISVAATNNNDMLWDHSPNVGSNYGVTNVDIAAPGRLILSTGPQNSYFNNTGTSMAAPFVTGACALLWEQHPELTYTDIKTALFNSVDILPNLSSKVLSGGRLNLREALTYYNTTPPPIGCRQSDSLALVAFYDATNGENWIKGNWDLTQPMDTWRGVSVNFSGCVIGLDLPGNLSTSIGTLAPEIGNLATLQILNLADCNIEGSIPATIGNLSNLRELNLSSCRFEGDLPTSIGNLSKLRLLNLSDNEIDGNIFLELNDLTALEFLDMAGCEQSGDIPSDLGYHDKLQHLDLSNNGYVNMHASLGNLKNLTYLDLRSNDLIGEIPFGIYSMFGLRHLDLSENFGLGDSIPPEIGNLTKLQELHLSRLGLTGSIPPEIGNLVSLKHLDLKSNNHNGEIPDELANLSNLETFHLGSNHLTGSIPAWIGNFYNLTQLTLDDNKLTGTIPAEIGALASLHYLTTDQNSLSGCFDPNLLNLSLNGNHNYFISNGNNFDASWEEFIANGTGACLEFSIPACRQADSLALVSFYNINDGANWEFAWDLNQPMDTWAGIDVNGFGCVSRIEIVEEELITTFHSDLGNLSYLTHLILRYANITGGFPQEILGLTNLLRLNLKGNSLVGNLPNQIDQLTRLQRFNLSENNFTGDIPTALTNLEDLRSINLKGNDLTGHIPSEIGNISTLNFLDLSGNELTGPIPTGLGNISNIEEIRLYNNNLIGGIPNELGNFQQLSHFDIRNNNLSGCFSLNLQNLCGFDIPSYRIDDGNNFAMSWESYCETGEGACELVWPGDYDYNGIVAEQDVLYWGLAYGFTGDARLNASSDFAGQLANDWLQSVHGINSKHQDGNGDGIVNNSDLQTLEDNFASIHDFTNAVFQPDSIIVEFEEGGSISGNPRYDVYITFQDNESIDVHGVSGVIEFGNWEITDVDVDVSNSSLEPSEIFKVYDPIHNRLHFALTRTDKVNKECDGPIASFIIETGFSPADDSYSFTMENSKTIKANGDIIHVAASSYYPQKISNLAGNDLVIGASVRHQQCLSLGSVSLNVEGGESPYTYSWNTGATSNSLINLTENTYEVIVTDAIGQTESLSVVVEGQYITLPDEFGNYPDCINPACPTLISPVGRITDGTYHANTAINAIATIDGNVEFKAGEVILLNEGFEVLQDNIFTVEIGACED